MTETTEKMAPFDACRWYYEQQAAGRKMEMQFLDPHLIGWRDDLGYYRADCIYRLKQLRRGELFKDGMCRGPAIDYPGPEAVILSRMPTRHEIHVAADAAASYVVDDILALLQSLALEVER